MQALVLLLFALARADIQHDLALPFKQELQVLELILVHELTLLVRRVDQVDSTE